MKNWNPGIEGQEVSRYLLDTHTFLWWVFNDDRLSYNARQVIKTSESRLYFSAASAWEISTKHRIGKLTEAGSVVDDLPGFLSRARVEPLPINLEDALLAGSMKREHRDPFDRMIIAQAQLRKIPIVTNDSAFHDFTRHIIW